MLLLRAACSRCGEVTLPVKEISLHVSEEDPVSFYSFHCPKCGQFEGGEADSLFVYLLLSSGVKPGIRNIPAEVFERREGTPLKPDDLLDFHLLLKKRNWFRQLRDLLPGEHS